MHQSLLGHALQEMKPNLVPAYHSFQQAPTPQPTPPPFHQQQQRLADPLQDGFYDFSTGQLNRPDHRRAMTQPISQSMPISPLDFSARMDPNEMRQSPERFQNGFPIPNHQTQQHFFQQSSYMQ